MKKVFLKIVANKKHLRTVIALAGVFATLGLIFVPHSNAQHASEYLNLLITFDKGKEVQKRLEYTDKYIEEAVSGIEKDDWDSVKESIDRYGLHISEIENIVTDAESEDVLGMLTFVASSTESHRKVFQDIVLKTPREMRAPLLRLIEKNIGILETLQKQYITAEADLTEFENKILGNTEGKVSVSKDDTEKKPVTKTKTSAVAAGANNHAGLAITDVSEVISGQVVTLTWNTGVEARSHVLVNGQSFDSVEGVSKTHTVYIKNLAKGKTYSYKIVANTLGTFASEDTVNRSFKTASTYTIAVSLGDDTSCFYITVSDNEEYLVRGYQMEIEGKNIENSTTYPRKTYITNSNGEILYCHAGVTYLSIESKDVDVVTGGRGVSVYNRTYENLTTQRIDEYGMFLTTFQLYKN